MTGVNSNDDGEDDGVTIVRFDDGLEDDRVEEQVDEEDDAGDKVEEDGDRSE